MSVENVTVALRTNSNVACTWMDQSKAKTLKKSTKLPIELNKFNVTIDSRYHSLAVKKKTFNH